ncbi:MAG: endolytic transglycosylase MltG [Actinomycetota bacterium]
MTDRDIDPHAVQPPFQLAPGARPGRTRAQQQRRTAAALIIVVAILGGVGALAVTGGRKIVGSVIGGPPDYKGAGGEDITVVVPKGATAVKIGAVLKAAGVVKSAGAFTDAARSDDRAKSIQPGSYRLKLKMSGKTALASLLDPKTRIRGQVTIPEGKTLAQILEIVSTKTKIPVADLQAAAAKPASLGLPAYAAGHVEGFLFPATYDILPDATATAVLSTMVNRFEQEATKLGLVDRAKQVNLTPFEAVVVASMIERETKYADEGPKIARVIYNRLKKKQPLQIDATIQYLLPKQKPRLLNTDLAIPSPYNTYLHTGLPPGAISCPGSKSLESALSPEAGNWRWYVVTDASGHHEFADTEAQFLVLKAKGKAATGG